MSDKVDVFMPLYVADYLADTTDLSTEEHGAYLLLLMSLWRHNGRLPCDPPRLARIVGLSPERWEAAWTTIGRFFDLADGHITQGRLLRELEAAKTRRQVASENGRRGNEARWGRKTIAGPSPPDESAMAKPVANHRSSPSPSPSPSESPPTSPSQGDPRASARPPARSLVVSPEPQDLYERMLASFGALWHDRYGKPYVPTPKDRSQFGRLLAGLKGNGIDPDELPSLFRNYLADDSHFVAQEKRHSLDWFCTDGGLNKYRTRAVSSGLSDKEKRGVRNAQVWLDMHAAKEAHGQQR